MTAFWKLRKVQDTVLEACKLALASVADLSDLEAAQAENAAEIEALVTLSRQMIDENAHKAMDQNEYNNRWTALQERYNAAIEHRNQLSDKQHERLTNILKLKGFIQAMEQKGKATVEFNESFFLSVTERMTVYQNGRVTVTFRDGSTVEC